MLASSPRHNTAQPTVGTSARPVRRQPIRTCVACRTSGGKRGLLRVVRLPENRGVVLDATGKTSGRGAYICPTSACITIALKQKKLERSLKAEIAEETVLALQAAIQRAEGVADETATSQDSQSGECSVAKPET